MMPNHATTHETRSRIVYRQALPKDAADQAEVFYHAVMQGATGHYDLAQRKAWAGVLPRTAGAWGARQLLFTTLVADCDGRCVGFLELDMAQARIETLYVWPSLTRRGIGKTLLIHAERALLEHGIEQVFIEASLALGESLARRGWHCHGEEWVERSGVGLPRLRMSKRLSLVET